MEVPDLFGTLPEHTSMSEQQLSYFIKMMPAA